MTKHSAWRLSLAREVASAYAALPQIESVFVHGSVGRGWADEHSDLEMGCIWSSEPTPELCCGLADSLGAKDWEWGNYDESRQGWNEQFLYKSMEVEVCHWTHEAVDSIISDVIEGYDTTQHWLMFNKQATVSVLQNGIILSGEEVIDEWRKKVAHYPEELAVSMVQKHSWFNPFGSQEMLAKRDEVPLLYENDAAIVRRLLGLLFGLNRIYFPAFKWTHYHVEEMNIKPRDFFSRLKSVFQSDAVSGTRELRQLIEETFDLVEQHLPQVDLKEQRGKFAKLYKRWELPKQED